METNHQIASLFFWLSAFSTPFIKSIYYLEARGLNMRVSPPCHPLHPLAWKAGRRGNANISSVTLGGVMPKTKTVINLSGRYFSSFLNRCREVGLMGRYNWRPEIPSGNGPTGAHILVALTAAFGTLAFFALLHSASNLKSGAASFSLVVSQSSVTSLIPILHNRIKGN
jgi:hypothetical protein